ncbi:hypothetical protein LSTR_LSTR009215 [Laodelphax striatellus]|uniref:Uncharacterized protein n=1 Tax=Laodelphax striatellus TaxID=195883 RepID=A0A482WQB4_LAOST|nr:hypothetical protein LSTR_LSTR009215 [Laodelphax striatellus]
MEMSDHSKDARKSLVENYIKFKRGIMQLDFNPSAFDEIDISTKSVVEKVIKAIGKLPKTKRRSSTKSRSSDDEDADVRHAPKSRRTSGGSSSRVNKRRSSTKSKSSDDEDADVSYTPRSERKSGGSNPESGKKSSSKNGESSSTAPGVPVTRRSSRSSVANEDD